MKADFFTRNRQMIGNQLGLIVLVANSRMQSSDDAFYPFEQESNFWYLTGIDEPDWLLIIDGTRSKSWLVAPDIETVHETFDGTLSAAGAQMIAGVDTVVTRDEALSLFTELAKKHSVVYTLGDHPHKSHFNFFENPAQRQLAKQLERTFQSVQDCRKSLAKQRAIKQPEEVQAIKKAIAVTATAFNHVKQSLDNYKYEYEITAEFDYRFRQINARHAYTPIVAGGANACTLHYVANADKLKKRQLVLLDIGAKVNGYAADITRTYGYGQLTQRQQAIHDGVVTAQREIIGLIGPGVSTTEYADKVDTIMKRLLVDLGLMKGSEDEEAYRRYFPHAVSHGLGIDVHDSLGGAHIFEPGMVLTVEPGVYVNQEGIGIRIEDDILVTDSGSVNLSKALSTEY